MAPLHNPFWVPYWTGPGTLDILHHSPIRDIYFSGDLKGLRQYRVLVIEKRLAIRGWSSGPNLHRLHHFMRRAPCTKPSPTQQVETSSAVFATAALVSGNCKLRSSSHSPDAKPQVMTQESEIGSMKSA